MRIFFSVGEPSGDLHASNLIRELKRQNRKVECVGYGGPKMAAAGCDVREDLTQFSFMGFLKVLLNIRTFWNLATRAEKYFKEHTPDAVILVDYPGFNWHIARLAQKYDIPVFYYGAPQMWAWASWRINKMRKWVDHVLCKLPFEAKWYQLQGCRATYVGHPYFDEMTALKYDESFLCEQRQKPGKLVAILPGSRTAEVENNLQFFLKAAERISQQEPAARFAIASFNEAQAETAAVQVEQTGLPIDVFVGRTPELIHLSHCCMACSGSVSLELLHHTKPTVILYWVNHWMYALAIRLLIKVKYITLVNLLAAEQPFASWPRPFDPTAADADQVPLPEYPTYEDKSPQIAQHLVEWLTDESSRQRRIEQLADLKRRFGNAGASEAAANYILNQLGFAPAAASGTRQRDAA